MVILLNHLFIFDPG